MRKIIESIIGDMAEGKPITAPKSEARRISLSGGNPEFQSMMADAIYMKILAMLTMADEPSAEEVAEVRANINKRVDNVEDLNLLLNIMDENFPTAESCGSCPGDKKKKKKKVHEVGAGATVLGVLGTAAVAGAAGYKGAEIAKKKLKRFFGKDEPKEPASEESAKLHTPSEPGAPGTAKPEAPAGATSKNMNLAAYREKLKKKKAGEEGIEMPVYNWAMDRNITAKTCSDIVEDDGQTSISIDRLSGTAIWDESNERWEDKGAVVETTDVEEFQITKRTIEEL